jgi:hypothetical protein
MWTFKIQAQFDRLNQHDVSNSKAIILKLRRRKRAHLSKIMIPKNRLFRKIPRRELVMYNRGKERTILAINL